MASRDAVQRTTVVVEIAKSIYPARPAMIGSSCGPWSTFCRQAGPSPVDMHSFWRRTGHDE